MLRALYGLLPRRLRRSWGFIVLLTGLCSVAELTTTALLLSVIRLATQPPGSGTAVLFPWMPGAQLPLALITLAYTAFWLVLIGRGDRSTSSGSS